MSSDTSTSKRTLESSDSDDSLQLKRACTSPSAIDQPLLVPIPVGIPHALQRIASFSLEETIVGAAATGQCERLKELLKDSKGDLTDALVAAASNGHFQVVETLLHQLNYPGRDYLDNKGYETLRKAVIPAARHGHRPIVQLLLSWLSVDGEIDKDTAWRALDEAAANGQLEVVKFVAGYVVRTKYDEEECSNSKAVSLAIAGGYADVVGYLLRFPWNLAYAFMEVIMKEQHVVAERIYLVYPMYFGGKNLLVEMAGDGFTSAVKYMYEHGHDGKDVLEAACVKAAACQRTEVLELLVSFGISTGGLNKALKAAATTGSMASVSLLVNKGVVSLMGIYQAFEMSGSLAVFRYLRKEEQMPATSITEAFKNVTGIGSKLPMRKKDRKAIAVLLCKEKCIPPDVICTAFAMTAYDMENMVEAMCDNPCISADVVCAALRNAAASGHINIVRFLVEKPEISAAVRRAAIMDAARNNHLAVVRILVKHGDCPLETLREALKVTSNPKIQQLLRDEMVAPLRLD
jgi:ankyrin repeat protein